MELRQQLRVIRNGFWLLVASVLVGQAGATHLSYTWVSPYAADTADDGTVTSRLTIQKQPGLRPGPLHLSIRVPDGAVIADTGAGLTVRGTTVTLDTTFDRDLALAIR